METFSALLALCAGNSPVTGEFPTQRPVMRDFDVFFNLRLNKRLSKQSWGRWFETPSRSLWRHCNAVSNYRHNCLVCASAIVILNDVLLYIDITWKALRDRKRLPNYYKARHLIPLLKLLSYWIHCMKHNIIFAFSIISQHRDDAGI